MHERVERLQEALTGHFGSEAADLAYLLDICLQNECTSYAAIDLPTEDKNECLLTAFEERALVPVQTRPSQGWDSCGLRFTPDESYFMPRVARTLLCKAQDSGKLDSEQAVQEVLADCSGADAEAMASLFAEAKAHVRSYRFEAGLLHRVLQDLNLSLDLHASMDMFVLAGMISPCTAVSVPSGLAWFEVNRCLFWE